MFWRRSASTVPAVALCATTSRWATDVVGSSGASLPGRAAPSGGISTRLNRVPGGNVHTRSRRQTRRSPPSNDLTSARRATPVCSRTPQQGLYRRRTPAERLGPERVSRGCLDVSDGRIQQRRPRVYREDRPQGPDHAYRIRSPVGEVHVRGTSDALDGLLLHRPQVPGLGVRDRGDGLESRPHGATRSRAAVHSGHASASATRSAASAGASAGCTSVRPCDAWIFNRTSPGP